LATLTDLASRVLRRIGAIDPDENPTAKEAQAMVDIFNEMFAEWAEEDCDIALTLPVDGADTVTDQLQISAIVNNAALKAAQDFAMPVTQQLYDMAYRSKMTLQKSLETMANVELDQALLDAGKRRDTEIL
jgi:hypothetical protein